MVNRGRQKEGNNEEEGSEDLTNYGAREQWALELLRVMCVSLLGVQLILFSAQESDMCVILLYVYLRVFSRV